MGLTTGPVYPLGVTGVKVRNMEVVDVGEITFAEILRKKSFFVL